jgi:colanic acid/amylovoran biosynthesis glycosyltransferase
VLTVAYLANQFPSPVEPYVGEEIAELRRRGVRVVTGSVRRSAIASGVPAEVDLQSLSGLVMLQAVWFCLRKCRRILPLIVRVIFRGKERPLRRLKALLHTGLGACYAARLASYRIEHIHVHHGYFGSWIAMAAARLLNVGFSMTLHGSDLLLQGSYLDAKLQHCTLCLTISEYNRRYVLNKYPSVDPGKIVVARLGVEVAAPVAPSKSKIHQPQFALLAVGRLHAVKDHAFLLRACAELYQRGVEFECSIAGEGPERRALEALIRKYGLENRVTLLGHVERRQMASLYDRADLVVLTSRSEGLPLVLMEAMARRKLVLAPAITGIPELVVPGKTGFLYKAGSLPGFVSQVLAIRALLRAPDLRPCPNENFGFLSARRPLDWVRHAARVQVRHSFDRKKNLEVFGDLFIRRIAVQAGSLTHENSLLQQVQLSVQRHRSLPV